VESRDNPKILGRQAEFINASIRIVSKIDFAIRAHRMEQLCGATGELLMLVSWLRDSGTVPDLHRTRDCAQLLAEELRSGPYEKQIDDGFLDDLHHACVLRDVGQLSVPQAVRNKRRAMTADEAKQLRQHTLVGSRLLNRLAGDHPGVSLFRMASEVARSHHEHLDGSGYPDHLSGDEIPLAARIMRAIDAFEAVADDEESETQLTPTYLQDELVKGRGTRFDPVVVNAFCNVFEQFQEAGADGCSARQN
jgi:putative two-component system response regulator